jgi:hypothetical protein
MVIDATFKIISVISGRPVFLLLEEYPQKSTDLSEVTDKLYHINVEHINRIHYRIEYNNKYVHHETAYLSTH